jgi:hypothetical protein|tara:strand:- start:414 stop:731 length:318 start_codon:yes stop_codon:yes gene_type:complete
MEFGVYGCKNESKIVVYIGSSRIPLGRLERNHRNYHLYSDGYESKFRKNLREKGKEWTFEWILKPMKCTQKGIETVEKAFINFSNPLYNVDKDPVKSSIMRGDYK